MATHCSSEMDTLWHYHRLKPSGGRLEPSIHPPPILRRKAGSIRPTSGLPPATKTVDTQHPPDFGDIIHAQTNILGQNIGWYTSSGTPPGRFTVVWSVMTQHTLNTLQHHSSP